ncbi:hypothetical protein ACG7TL_008464 [Trametes sanguinea]
MGSGSKPLIFEVLTPEDFVSVKNASSPPQEPPGFGMADSKLKVGSSDDARHRVLTPRPTRDARLDTSSAHLRRQVSRPLQTQDGIKGPSSAPFHKTSFDGHSSAAQPATANLPMSLEASSSLPGSDMWARSQGSAFIAGPSEAVSSPFAPSSSSSAAYYCPPPYWNRSATPNQHFAFKSVGANMANELERSYPQHHQVAAQSSRSATDPKNRSNPSRERRGPKGQKTPSLLNDGDSRRVRPILLGPIYSRGSVAEYAVPRSTTVHTSSSFATRSITNTGYAPASTSDVASADRQPLASLGPHHDVSRSPPMSATSDSPIPPSEIVHAPGNTGASSTSASSSLRSHGDLANSMPDVDITGTLPSQFALSIDKLIDTIDEALRSPSPALPAASASTHEQLNTEGSGDNQGVLTSASAQQRTSPPSVASPLARLETVSQGDEGDEQEPGEATTGMSTALEGVSRPDEDFEHWHQGVRGQDGYIYQLPPPILWHRPSSRLHDQLWV